MNIPQNLKQITVNHLFDHGFDGLFNTAADCGCLADDLMPCGSPGTGCQTGYKTTHADGWTIQSQPIKQK